MLHAHNQDPLYRVVHNEEQTALVDALAFNVQDRNWLVYCALGGHQHHDWPDSDPRTGMARTPLYGETA
ncbi:hypothetical protein D9M68_222220 [compost metagenome]